MMLKNNLERDTRKGTREGLCHWPDTFPSLGSVTIQTVLRLRAFSNYESWDYYLGQSKDLSINYQLGMRLDNLTLKKDVILFCDVLCREKEHFP